MPLRGTLRRDRYGVIIFMGAPFKHAVIVGVDAEEEEVAGVEQPVG